MKTFQAIICIVGPILILFTLFVQTGYWTKSVRKSLTKNSQEQQKARLIGLKSVGLINLRQYQQLRQDFNIDPKPTPVPTEADPIPTMNNLPTLNNVEIASCRAMALTFSAAPKHIQGFQQLLEDNLRLTKAIDILHKKLEIKP
jgi:hypothetical protein